MIRKILAVASAVLMCSGVVASAAPDIANGIFAEDLTPYSDFSEESWTGWQREYFYWGEIENGKMVLTSTDPKTLMPTSGALTEGRAVRQRSLPIGEVVDDYENDYGDYILLIRATVGMPEKSDVMGYHDGVYDSSNQKSYAEIAFGAYDPWNPAVTTRLVRFLKDDDSETYSVYVNMGANGRLSVPEQCVKSGVSDPVDVKILVNGNAAKYFIDGKYCGTNTFTVNPPSDSYDIGFYCVGGDENDPISVTVDNAEIAVYQKSADSYLGENDDTVVYSFDMESGLRFLVSGNMKKEKLGEEVRLSLLTKELTEIASGQSVLGADGNFEISVPVPESAAAGEYLYKLSLGNGKELSGTFMMPDYFALDEMFSAIAKSRSTAEIQGILDAGANVCSGIGIVDEVYPKADKKLIAETLYGLLKANDYPETVSDFAETVKAAAILSAFNQGLGDYPAKLIDRYAGEMGISSECMDYYNHSLTDTGVSNVLKHIKGASFRSYSDFEERFRHLVYTNYITNNTSAGKENRDAIIRNSAYTLGLSFGEIPESVMFAMSNSHAATPEALMAVYKEKTSAKDSGSSGSGGSGGNGGSVIGVSGGGSGGGYVPPRGDTPSDSTVSLYFDDLGNDAWAAEAINFLKEKGVVTGKADRAFFPKDKIKREEAIAMLSRMFGLKEKNDLPNPFEDVSRDAWYFDAVSAAVGNGIVTGMSENHMGIGLDVTRQDFLVMMLRAVITDSVINVYDVPQGMEFTDFESVSEYAREAVKLFSGLGIVNGYEDGSIQPGNSISRAEAAQIMYKISQLREVKG